MEQMVLSATVSLLMLMIMQSSNPAMLGVFVMLYSVMITSTNSHITGSKWFMHATYILFAGGVLMVFMMLSAICPNEAPKKYNKAPILFVSIFLIMGTHSINSSQNQTQMNPFIKWVLEDSKTMIFLTFIILAYFLSFSSMLSVSSSSLRACSTCWIS